ncbi:MAG: hypothetical protein SH819_14815 [Cytophagales bacterium]|nr:hypothetical protein [Cytophagales bacterium]
MKIALGLLFIAAGLFFSLTAFGILHPYKNKPEKLAQIHRNRILYIVGGFLSMAYGLYRLLQ